MRTSRRDVKVGPLTNQNIAILEGLNPGELIIAAGVNAVRENMWVRPMERERGL
jgi:multidrug efflux pump subunit AcrA (membrane-fusion protein)